MTVTITKLPPYPSAQARRQLPASQLVSLNAIVASALAQVITLPPAKRDIESSRSYVRSYARDVSFQTLQSLIWGFGETPRVSKDEELIRKNTLKLAEKVAPSLDLQTLLDLAIGYSTIKGYKQRLKGVLAAASEAGNSIHGVIEKDLVPSLTLMLSPQSQIQGLYALRKTAHCILSFLRASPPSFIRHFAHSKHFVLALAQAYDTSLTSIAASYGGVNVLRNAIDRAPDSQVDDWERIWVDTKVALVDSFHVLLDRLLEDLSSAKGSALGVEAERTFDIIFGLLELSSTGPSSVTSTPLTPFLNRPLLADYQQSYSLSRTLASALKHAEEKDARLDILESALGAFDAGNGPNGKEPGALKIVLRSYGIQQGIDNLGTQRKHHQPLSETTKNSPPVADPAPSRGKGKAKAPAVSEDPELDNKVVQILDVLPDTDPEYIRLLLGSSRYKGDPEQVLGALLEGRALTEEELVKELEQQENIKDVGSAGDYDISQRRNVFDDQEFHPVQVTTGKKNIDGGSFLKDQTFIEQMKADILRRAEAIFEEEEEEDTRPGVATARTNEREIFSAEDELEEAGGLRIKVAGDGEETDESDAENEDEGRGEEKMTAEVILELAWTRDPKLFDRGAVTRRSKERERLRKDTGWADEQIEGWKIMLDRNPKLQEKIKQKHEFRGNQNPIVPLVGPSGGGHDRGSGRGRGRGGRGSRGGNSGRGGAQGSSGDSNTPRDRSFKNQHKASRANHNRKRGHDKKMARAGAGVLPS